MRLGQSRAESIFEICLSTAIGFIIAFTANLLILPLFGFTPTFSQNFWLTVFFTVISIIRGILVRRLFNKWHETRLRKELFGK